MKFVRALKEWRFRIFYRLLLHTRSDLVTLGEPAGGCSWTVCSSLLGPQSIVYCGGVGNDVSFERALVNQFGCEVVLCDPSPTGEQTMQRPENKLRQFHFRPLALTAHRGMLRLARPLNETGDWWLSSNGNKNGSLELPCTDLASLMAERGHAHIDLLKLDIEGSEYAVLDDLLAHRLPVRQICVEYHHGILPGIARSKTISSILRLLTRGYKLVDQNIANHTFVRKRSKLV
jgi:FkbM family methyltransferase